MVGTNLFYVFICLFLICIIVVIFEKLGQKFPQIENITNMSNLFFFAVIVVIGSGLIGPMIFQNTLGYSLNNSNGSYEINPADATNYMLTAFLGVAIAYFSSEFNKKK